jgi:mRNA-degrading endonuclease RelE of RelBE toxin-antitoxin system
MYEDKLQPMTAKAPARHVEFMESVAKELMQFDPEEQNEVVKFIRKVSIEERMRKADQLRKEAEYLNKSCEALN